MRTLKIIITFIGLKLLELASIAGLFAIMVYVNCALEDWSFDGLFLPLKKIFLFAILTFMGFITIIGLWAIIVDWIKSNWRWAKEIVDKKKT